MSAPSDPVRGRAVLCHRAGEDVPLLLPAAQGQGHGLLPGGGSGGVDRLAHHRGGAGDLRLLPLVQVSGGVNLNGLNSRGMSNV